MWAAWRRVAGVWRFAVLPPQERIIERLGATAVVVAGVGRNGVLGEQALLRLP